MEKHLNLKMYVSLKKGVLISSELLVLFLILGSSIVMADTGFSEQNKSLDVQKSVSNQTVSSLNPGLAPENPEFAKYQKNKVFTPNEQSLDGRKKGLVPSPVNLHNVGHISSSASLSCPIYYDLRALNKVTTIKDQGMTGSCWAFATYASFESYFMPGKNWDFSENNLKNLLSNKYSEGFDYDEGGNMFMSTAYLARWSGPVAESDDPYSDSSSYSPTVLPLQKHVQDIIFLSDRQGSLDNQEIKSAVQTYGAIYTSMCYDDAYYSPTTSSYYYDGSDYSNHAVAIVGWNDSFDKNKFTKVPPGDGAFIIKNSWGTGWGDQGYFYVSYYDTRIGAANGVFKAENVNNYKSIYQYDPFGWVLSCGYYNSVGWIANIFTAKSNEVLKAVSFYTTDINCNYEIYIYTDPKSNPINQASLALTQKGVISNAGYHTVNLNSGVPLKAGQKFSVVLKLTTPGYDYPIAIEYPCQGYSSKATAHTGESFVSTDGKTWTDMTKVCKNTNVCIKAFTDPASVLSVANFLGTPLSGAAPLQVTFTNRSTGSPTSWYWDFGDGTNSTAQNPAHVYNKAGRYTVSLRVSNTAGSNTLRKTGYVTVTAPRPPTAAFTANRVSGKAQLTVTFTDTSSGTPTSWNWNFGDGTQNSLTKNPVHIYSKAGKYTVILTVRNANGSNAATKGGYITVSR